MTEETIKRVLKSYGLTDKETELYIFLAKHGATKGVEISKSTKNDKAQTYRLLKNLQSKSLVEATLESPVRFAAVPFEKLLESFIKNQQDEVTSIEKSKDDLVKYLKNNRVPESTQERFTVIEDLHKIYVKVIEMTKNTTNELCVIFTIPDLLVADQNGVLDEALNQPRNLASHGRFLITELQNQNLKALKGTLDKLQSSVELRGRNPDSGVKTSSRMVIRDDDEALFFIARGNESSPSKLDDVCIWTNCKSLVHTFKAVFEDLWKYSVDLQKIVESGSIDAALKTNVISDPEDAHNAYEQALFSAKKKVTLLVPTESINEIAQNRKLLDVWAKSKVSVKIMAPITSANFQAAQELLKGNDVRHVALGYLNTAIIDGQHLFQSKKSVSLQSVSDSNEYFKDMLHTNNPRIIQELGSTLDELWKNTQALSNMTLQAAINPPPMPPPPEVGKTVADAMKKLDRVNWDELNKAMKPLTEKDVIQRMINAKKRLPDSTVEMVTYGIVGQAIIHPPINLGLPSMLFYVTHNDKNSTFGEEDSFAINVWCPTPMGYAYLPAAYVSDNPKTLEMAKKFFSGFPVNIQFVKKEELQVTLYGNTLFAGWTVPLNLTPQLMLQPGCITLEGYGNVQTGTHVMEFPSDYQIKRDFNGFEAFVTFLYPQIKYSGPGTDGFLARDTIAEYMNRKPLN